MTFLLEYGLFLAKTVTFVVAVLVLVAVVAGLSRRQSSTDTLEVENLNERFRALGQSLQGAMLGKAEQKEFRKSEKQHLKKAISDGSARPRTFVVEFKGDIRASAAEALRQEVSAILAAVRDGDDVVLKLENPGGVVHEHGLAASQLVRLRDREIPLTVVVDKVAASGGYLMACVANKIVAAPFAILGSIGVLAQLPNFNRLLDKHGIDFEQITAGRYKRSVTVFGKNTDADRAKLKEELEEIHRLFKDVVARFRPELDIEAVATGEHWYGTQAIDLGLADSLSTSDQLLLDLSKERDLFKVHFKVKQPLAKKLLGGADALLQRLGA